MDLGSILESCMYSTFSLLCHIACCERGLVHKTIGPLSSCGEYGKAAAHDTLQKNILTLAEALLSFFYSVFYIASKTVQDAFCPLQSLFQMLDLQVTVCNIKTIQCIPY